MTEIERIQQNTNGEVPSGKYDILRVEDLSNPEEVLEIFKKCIVVFLENKDLDSENEKWEKLLPHEIVSFIGQLNDDDYSNDDLLSDIDLIIHHLQVRKEWEWYSSKLYKEGFEVFFEGIFRGSFVELIHCQGIPINKITIESNGVVYPLSNMVYKDITSYKSFK